MKFTIEDDHRDYFQKNHRIEFEGVLTDEDTFRLKQEIECVLAERLQVSQEKVMRLPASKLFEVGRDLWRTSNEIKEISCQRAFGEVASLLTDLRSLRLGYDQFLPVVKPSVFPSQDTYLKLLQTSATLKEISCLQNLACGLLLCLTGGAPPGDQDSSRNVIFLAPEAPVIFLETLNLREHSYYLIVFTKAKSVYIHNKRDPHSHGLLQWGYHFGDRLKDELNPIIFR
ncbi:MAG: hypothetical protein ACE5GN_01395 [Waddliaceae bacterium]